MWHMVYFDSDKKVMQNKRYLIRTADEKKRKQTKQDNGASEMKKS